MATIKKNKQANMTISLFDILTQYGLFVGFVCVVLRLQNYEKKCKQKAILGELTQLATNN
jgi:hypothetical protein